MSIQFFVTSLIVILAPGTGVLYTVATGLAAGRGRSIAAAFGCTLGILPHIAASALGLAALLHTSAVLFQAIKFAGIAYLFFLGWQTLRQDGPLRIRGRDELPPDPAAIMRTGFLVNILNPKLSLFFMAFLPQFVGADPETAVGEMLLLGGLFMAMTFAVFVLYGVGAALAGEHVFRNPRIMRWVRRTVAAAFAGFGLKLAFESR